MGVHAVHGVRIVGSNEDADRQIRHHLPELFFFPGQHPAQGFLIGVQVIQPALQIVHPFHVHLFRPGFVAFLHHHGGESVLLHGNGQLHDLALLHVRAGADDQLRVLLQQLIGNTHGVFLPHVS